VSHVVVGSDRRLLAPGLPGGSPGRPVRRWSRVLLALGSAGLLVAALVGWWAHDQIDAAPGGAPVTIDVLAGQSVHDLIPELERDDVIGNSLLFKAYLHVANVPVLRPGPYVLHRHEAYAAILRAFARGPTVYRLTIPPGFDLRQIAEAVGRIPGHTARGFLATAASGVVRSPYEPPGVNDLEGLLYPDTYLVGPQDSNASILEQMVQRFDQVAASIGLPDAPALVGVSPYQAVIVASLVEREAKLPADRGKVAEVIYNRLRAGRKLQIDATVVYALGGGVSDLTPQDLAVRSPYNTYLVQGLPPTPIASPGRASLEAALHPTPGPWLYFVVVSRNGAEAFSTTLAGQDRNIALARSRGLR
jgi:UPF0755 protein